MKSVYWQVLGVGLLLALAGPARAGEQVPLQGHGSGVLYPDFTISGVGQVSHLGFSMRPTSGTPT